MRGVLTWFGVRRASFTAKYNQKLSSMDAPKQLYVPDSPANRKNIRSCHLLQKQSQGLSFSVLIRSSFINSPSLVHIMLWQKFLCRSTPAYAILPPLSFL